MFRSPMWVVSRRLQSGLARAPILLAAALVAAAILSLAVMVARPTPAPQVSFVSLKGEKFGTAELKGRVVLINFWATDCPICVKEMPEMARTYERYRERGLDFVAVAMRHDPPNYVIRYAAANRLPFKVALDPAGEIAKAFGDVQLTPTTFVIDRRGNIVQKFTGEPDFAGLRALIEEKLKETI